MYAGHHGRAPARNFARPGIFHTIFIYSMKNFSEKNNINLICLGKIFFPDWHRYVTIQADRWLDMASNWTIHSSSQKVKFYIELEST